MSAYRCTICAANWPPEADYSKTCPECGSETSYVYNADAMPADEARSRKNHADFERWCEERGRT